MYFCFSFDAMRWRANRLRHSISNNAILHNISKLLERHPTLFYIDSMFTSGSQAAPRFCSSHSSFRPQNMCRYIEVRYSIYRIQYFEICRTSTFRYHISNSIFRYHLSNSIFDTRGIIYRTRYFEIIYRTRNFDILYRIRYFDIIY